MCICVYVLFYVSLGCQDVSSLGRGVLCVCSVLCDFRLWALGRGVLCVCSVRL